MSHEERIKAARVGATFDRIKAGLADYFDECGVEYMDAFTENLDIMVGMEPAEARRIMRKSPDHVIDEFLFMARAGAALVYQCHVDREESRRELDGT